MRRAALAVILCLLGMASAQESRLVEGYVYTYTKDGMRHYTAQPPAEAADVRRIKYSFYETVSPYPSTRSFGGFPCRQDCSGHRAGYDWAKKKGIRAAAQCGGRSQSFIEGCIVFAEGLAP